MGYRLHEDASSLKCYMADTGLLVSLAFDDGPDLMDVHRDIQFGRISINKGMLIENIVAQQQESGAFAFLLQLAGAFQNRGESAQNA